MRNNYENEFHTLEIRAVVFDKSLADEMLNKYFGDVKETVGGVKYHALSRHFEPLSTENKFLVIFALESDTRASVDYLYLHKSYDKLIETGVRGELRRRHVTVLEDE